MTPLIRAVIDTAALRANLEAVRARAPGAKVMAVVKANAYGHGLIMTAVGLPGADAYAVARLEEGIMLREAGITRPIILLEGVFSAEQVIEAAVHRFEVVVHDPLQIALLEAFRGSFRSIAWLKIDTGMNRLGFRPEEFTAALQRLRELRLLTHLARADERDAAATAEQVRRFRAAIQGLDLATSIGNSAGIFGWPEAAGDWVRPGLALYGVSPFPDTDGASLGLRPVMTLETAIIGLRRVLRSLRDGAPVLIDGRRAPLVGRVSMDMIAVDVTDLPEPRLGTRCLLWGPGLPVEEVAANAGTVSYEMLCGVRQRVPHEAI